MTALPPHSTDSEPVAVTLPRLTAAPGTMSHPANGPLVAAPGGFDLWGPLQRRRYLIVLFCLVGIGVGYLYYTQAPREYSSATRLMITTQAPPMMVDGDLRMEKQSLDKHASLVSSELVLEEASRNGKFESLETFSKTSYPVAGLRQMLNIVPETDETLTIICNGPNPDDLPMILSQITASYESVIREDSQDFGQKTIDLIQQLASRLSNEKDDAEMERYNLWVQLEIESTDNEGNPINPHYRKLSELKDQSSELQAQLGEVQDRYQLLAENLKVDPQTGQVDATRLKISALEAGEYLGLQRTNFRNESIGVDRSMAPERQQRQRLQGQVWSVDAKLEELQFERAKLSEKFGIGYSGLATLESQLQFYQQKRQELVRELNHIEAALAPQTERGDGLAGPGGDEPVDPDLLRAQEDREWITMYQLKLKQEQDRLIGKIDRLEEQIDAVSRKAQTVNNGMTELNRLQNEITQKGESVSTILEKLSEMNILNNNYSMTNVKVLDEPKRGQLVAPSLPKALGLGLVISFLVGVGLAVLVDQSELAFRNPAEIFERLQIPVVGRVPRINVRNLEPTQGHASLVAAHKPSANASEALRDVRTSLFFRANLEDIRTILLTSPSPGDGKSTTTANLAISIAQAGKRVVLVDADFRRPRVHQYFGQELGPGLVDVLAGETSLQQAIQPAALQDQLFLLPAGGRPANPGELVTSPSFRKTLEALRAKFDYVLIDSPPVLPVSDPATIASLVDGVYLVTRIRKGVKLTSQKAKETLDRVGANWMGVIVNGLDENPHYSEYGYQYGYYGTYGGYRDAGRANYRDRAAG